MAVYTIDPFDAQMPFPIDLRFVKDNVNDRNSIPTNARYPGLPCWTVSEKVLWVLNCDPGDEGDNANWMQIFPVLGGAIQTVTWSTSAPTGGANGDIRFRDNTSTGRIEIWFRSSGGSWGNLGSWSKEGAIIAATLNNSLDPFGTTSANLDSNYPSAKVGDIVYTDTGATMWTKLATGKWTRTSLDIV